MGERCWEGLLREDVGLAVLPLSSVAGESEGFLAVGIPDGIITRLSNVRQFRVRPTSAVARYHGQKIDAQDVGRRLGSQYVLVGTIRATANRVRVSVQLVRTTDGSPVWGGQSRCWPAATCSVSKMPLPRKSRARCAFQMSDAERERFYRRYTRNAAAYEHYLMGRTRLRALTEQGALHAIAEFEAARDRDPSYALAYTRPRNGCGADSHALQLAEGSRGLGRPPHSPRKPVALSSSTLT